MNERGWWVKKAVWPPVFHDETVGKQMEYIAEKPLVHATESGKMVVRCSFCQTELASDAAKARGYHPQCAKLFGFDAGHAVTP